MSKTQPPRPARRKADDLLGGLVYVVFALHVFLAPYTKVEESFTLHAVHDVLAHGFSSEGLAKWDHITFPGAVPRSFLPAVILGMVTYPLSYLGVSLGLIRTKVHVQILVRLVLSALNAAALNHLGTSLSLVYGRKIRHWFLILSITQFHLPFYAGRTLPNFMALPLVTLSISWIISSNLAGSLSSPASPLCRRAISVMVATAAVIRLEVALFVLPIALSLLLMGRLSIISTLTWGAIGGFGGLALSAPLDYLLWRPALAHPDFPFKSTLQIVWPEASSLWYNLYLGKSSEWGVSPWYYYIASGLPKITAASFPLASLIVLLWILSPVTKMMPSQVQRGLSDVMKLFALGIVTLVGGMSSIGHKEWRFVIYVVPIINVLAAFSASMLWHPPATFRFLLRLGLVGLFAANLAFTGFSRYVSMWNYPGGEAWSILEQVAGSSTITAHFTNFPLQSGASLFTFLHLPDSSPALPSPLQPEWKYSKSEDPLLQTPWGTWASKIDYIVTDDRGFTEWRKTDGEGWAEVGSVAGIAGWSRGGKYGIRLGWDKKIIVLGRSNGSMILIDANGEYAA